MHHLLKHKALSLNCHKVRGRTRKHAFKEESEVVNRNWVYKPSLHKILVQKVPGTLIMSHVKFGYQIIVLEIKCGKYNAMFLILIALFKKCLS